MLVTAVFFTLFGRLFKNLFNHADQISQVGNSRLYDYFEVFLFLEGFQSNHGLLLMCSAFLSAHRACAYIGNERPGIGFMFS
jgi:hypothetical protein